MLEKIKPMQRTLIFLLKALLFITLFCIFFLIFGIDMPWLLRPSRTAGVTMLTFAVLGISLMALYGGYAVGKQKSKAIIHSLVLATLITDVITHLQLCIMNTNERLNERFVYESPLLLLLIMALQIVTIIGFTYLGNYVFFTINPPERCCIVTSSQYSLDRLLPKVQKYRKQYQICEVVDYRRADVFDVMSQYDTIFLYDVPMPVRYQLVDYCYEIHRNLYYNLEMSDVVAGGAKHVLLDDVSLMVSTRKELSLEQRVIKRIMDMILSAFFLILASPVMGLAALCIKAEDGGAVLFRQKRATKDGQVFRVCKFRTMKEHPDDEEQHSAQSDDERITKVGAVLRKFRLDELPQLWNILRGEMSFVGPRPEMMENVSRYTEALPQFAYRLRVKAGLTGLAQVVGKYNTSPKDKLILDLIYIENYSLWLDIKLIFQTLVVFLKSSDSTEGFSEEWSFGDGQAVGEYAEEMYDEEGYDSYEIGGYDGEGYEENEE